MAIPIFIRIGEIIGQRIRLKLHPIKKVKIRRWHNEQFIGCGELDLTSSESIIAQLDKIDEDLMKRNTTNGR
ncbi:hypothetical protein QJU89_05900 [Pasteurella skyensis]|uniref:Uncharacterized protein n=1 Tax=Phocoenobacter skyensis TaxID=97481 RepID=A0AAJ6P0E6_9PAST|nr:hypothetical protein [Pasteurella skyensis]MDP8162824.1 hypothetical protein [Pasteurella skyensis]MDP8172589.1 hypothetical protein [Pasteurella skyensis]MDP8179089.1 hypothetical protein [Pasteurella skyensis]MDP8183226.1 hypothetical protein [Pasteurella skyensis]MDP8189277.1 hypothetical protein [Pasteurella skyensis]